MGSLGRVNYCLSHGADVKCDLSIWPYHRLFRRRIFLDVFVVFQKMSSNTANDNDGSMKEDQPVEDSPDTCHPDGQHYRGCGKDPCWLLTGFQLPCPCIEAKLKSVINDEKDKTTNEKEKRKKNPLRKRKFLFPQRSPIYNMYEVDENGKFCTDIGNGMDIRKYFGWDQEEIGMK